MSDDKKVVTRGERAVSWAKALSLLVATGIAVYAAAFKGEPGADEAKTRVDQTWKKAQDDIARLSSLYQKLHTRVVYFQGRDEGLRAGVLKAQLDHLQERYDRLQLSKEKRRKARADLEQMLAKIALERRKAEDAARKASAVKAVKSAKPLALPAPAPPPWRQSK